MPQCSQPVEIRYRDIDFDMRSAIPAHWLGGHCHRTRFYDAMSIMFPQGERAFIESVLFYRERISADTRLARDVAVFSRQEALHTREHRRYNARMAAQGVPVDALERSVAVVQDFMRRRLPPSARLAFSICMEHFTAILSDEVLKHPRSLWRADARMARIWRWHALEEIEHKAVAFDVFITVVRYPVWRYLLRCAMMLGMTLGFSVTTWYFTYALVRHDGRRADWRGWACLIREQCISPGFLLRIVPHWLAWFIPGFHPWWHDNRRLVADVRGEYDAYVDGCAHNQEARAK